MTAQQYLSNQRNKMKTQIITALILAASITASAQTKHLAPVSKIALTDKQVLGIDSAINAACANIDSKSLTKFITDRLQPLYRQITEQMIADKPKEVIAPPKEVKSKN
jgi:hypothetical protein